MEESRARSVDSVRVSRLGHDSFTRLSGLDDAFPRPREAHVCNNSAEVFITYILTREKGLAILEHRLEKMG